MRGTERTLCAVEAPTRQVVLLKVDASRALFCCSRCKLWRVRQSDLELTASPGKAYLSRGTAAR